MKEIIAVLANGITYLDEERNPQYLDFAICYQNYLLDMRQRMGARYMDEHREFYERHRIVAARRSLIRPQTLSFYSAPPTEFEFSSEDSFWQVLLGIKKAGYRTADGD